MGLGKGDVMAFDVVRGLAQDFKIPHHGILHFFVDQKGQFGQVIHIAVDAVNRLHDVAQVVHGAPNIVFTHTACASAST